jgi:formylglycine-generating enzyme required for sulfatase activity
MIDLGSYCIDSTEITQSQYQQFLTAKAGDVSGQSALCAWNASFQPETDNTPQGCNALHVDPGSRPNHPIVCIDWCDARAYCAWAGKRLCGTIPGGVPGEFNSEEWSLACSNGGTTTYPYGNTYEADACGWDQTTYAAQPVRSRPKCHGITAPHDQLYDMIRNVAELIEGRSLGIPADPAQQTVGALGEGVGPTVSEPTCRTTQQLRRNEVRYTVGFRCCTD